MSNLRTLQFLTSELQSEFDKITDPIELMPAADAIRAELAVILTEQLRRAATTAYDEQRMGELSEVTWRSRRYLTRMVEHSHKTGQRRPTDRVLDVLNAGHLDLDDLARLRGQG
jgi:hypothetical protein